MIVNKGNYKNELLGRILSALLFVTISGFSISSGSVCNYRSPYTVEIAINNGSSQQNSIGYTYCSKGKSLPGDLSYYSISSFKELVTTMNLLDKVSYRQNQTLFFKINALKYPLFLLPNYDTLSTYKMPSLT